MERFFYGQSDDAYFLLDEEKYAVLQDCISIISKQMDDKDMIDVGYAIRHDSVVWFADHIIKIILTGEQYRLYKEAPLY